MDHSVGRFQDFLCGTIVLFQFDHCCIREIFFKIKDISDIRAPPAIDRLVIIANYAEIFIFICQHSHQFILACIGILIFIYHNVLESVLIFFQHGRMLTEQQYCFIDQIIEIQRIIFFQHSLVSLIYFRNTYCFQVIFIYLLAVFFPACHFFLQTADDRHGTFYRKSLVCCAHVQAFECFTHDFFLIIAVINGKLIIIIQMMDFSS